MTRTSLVFVHGRSQGGRDATLLKQAWLEALRRGLGPKRMDLLNDVDVAFPFFGDILDGFAAQLDEALPADVALRGPGQQAEPGYLAFQREQLGIAQRKLCIDDAALSSAGEPVERGPLNWEWVHALLRAADVIPGISAGAIDRFTRDVYMYLSRTKVRKAINDIVEAAMPNGRAVVVGHSLGSVVAYDVMRNRQADQDVALYVSVGCPLGIGPIRRTLAPLDYPKGLRGWFNALDLRDVVALEPLDADHFGIDPPVENYLGVHNRTENAHGIDGYLDDPEVASRIADALFQA